jgi:hypothetical protein
MGVAVKAGQQSPSVADSEWSARGAGTPQRSMLNRTSSLRLSGTTCRADRMFSAKRSSATMSSLSPTISSRVSP